MSTPARVTPGRLVSLLKRDYDFVTSPDVSLFIETASELVDDVVQEAAALEIALTAGRARVIELWLAAHFYAVNDRIAQSKSEQGASATFQGQTGMGLDSTTYGQQAKALDPTGILSSVGTNARASVTWVGKAERDRLNYSDRN